MARKSRKSPIVEQNMVSKTKVYLTAIYVRLSFVYKKAEKIDPQGSIENQIILLKEYVQQKEDLLFIKIYVDNGKSGTNFKRTAFQELMEDIQSGKVNCIVVKDFSRFGRNYLEVGNYIQKVFPSKGIRFISVNDFYDSMTEEQAGCLPIRFYCDQLYAEDISEKIKGVNRPKQEKGEYLGSIPPYGYLRDEKNCHKLIIDNETVSVVRDIFYWKAAGMSDLAIANKLNELNILPPYRYFYERGIIKNSRYKDKNCWYKSAIKRITQNQMYLGKMVQGKYISYFLEGKYHEKTEQSNWIVVEGTHEPIISNELFSKVQEIRTCRKIKYDATKEKFKGLSTDNIFKEKIVCQDCGKKLLRRKFVIAGRAYYYFLCPSYEEQKICTKKSIREDKLISLIRQELLIHIKLLRTEKISYDISAKMSKIEDEISLILDEISKYKRYKEALYTDIHRELMSKEEADIIAKSYDKKIESFQDQYFQLSQTLYQNTKEETKLDYINKFLEKQEINQQLIENLIDKVIVSTNSGIEIHFAFSDPFFQNKEGGI